MFHKLLAAVTAVLLTLGVTTFVSSAASAHAGNMTKSVVCNTTTGMYDVTYTLNWSAAPKNGGTGHYRLGENSFINGWQYPGGKSWTDFAISTAAGSKSWTQSIPGTTVGNGPWTYAYIEWSDGYNEQKVFDTRIEGLKGDCKVPSTKVVPVAPTIVDLCGTANDTITLAANTANITYSRTGNNVFATLAGSNVEWGTAPSGWTTDGAKLKFVVPAFNTDPCAHTETVCWLMDNYKGGADQPTAGDKNTFPQTRVDCDTPVPCGMWVQKDVYKIDSAAKEEVWQNLGQTLTWVNGGPEDASIYKSHTFIYGGKCKPEQPQPKTGKDERHVQICTVPADGTATITYYEKSWTQNYTWNANTWEWVLGDKVYGAETVKNTTVVDDATCIPTTPENLKGTDPKPPTHVCVDPKNGTATDTTYAQDWTQTYTWSSATHTWVLGAKVYGPVYVVSSTVVDDQQCIPTGPEGLKGTDKLPPTSVCVEPKNGDATQTTWAQDWTQDYSWDNTTHSWVLGAKVYGAKYSTGETTIVDAQKCWHKEVVCWIMPDSVTGEQSPPAGSYNTFPQHRVDCDEVIPCGRWIQKDWYTIDSNAKEEVWRNLGDELEWLRGGPEDSAIYVAHQFIYGGDCVIPVDVCEYIDGVSTKVTYDSKKLPEVYIAWKDGSECAPTPVCVYTDGDDSGHRVDVPAGTAAPEGSKPWVDGSECTPALDIDLSTITPVCETGVPYLTVHVNLNDPGHRAKITYDADGNPTINLLFFDGNGHSEPMNGVPLDSNMDATILWPGASVDADGNGTGWPGWELQDGVWVNVGDGNFGWTRSDASLTISFNPETTLDLGYPEENFDCVTPPPTQVCEYTVGDATGHQVEYPAGQVPEGAIPWVDGTECMPDVCPNIQGKQLSIPEGLAWLKVNETKEYGCHTPPSLDGTLFSAKCIDDVPWIYYDVALKDDDDVSTDDGDATFTFSVTGDSDPAHTAVEIVPIGKGRFLWPGAEATKNGDGTYTATGWPGWALVDDEWISIGDDNYGWTRDGVNVNIKVNPEMNVTLSYPPPTALCVAGPPTEVHNELDAPPAKAVEAEAQYAG